MVNKAGSGAPIQWLHVESQTTVKGKEAQEVLKLTDVDRKTSSISAYRFHPDRTSLIASFINSIKELFGSKTAIQIRMNQNEQVWVKTSDLVKVFKDSEFVKQLTKEEKPSEIRAKIIKELTISAASRRAKQAQRGAPVSEGLLGAVESLQSFTREEHQQVNRAMNQLGKDFKSAVEDRTKKISVKTKREFKEFKRSPEAYTQETMEKAYKQGNNLLNQIVS